MEFYIPSLLIMLLGMLVAFAVVPQFTPMIIASFAAVCLVIAVYHHSTLFSGEYHNMNWANSASAASVTPYLLTGTVVVFSIGYIIMLITSGKAPSLQAPSMTIPPPYTATNSLTQAIGTGLASTNIAQVGPPQAAPNNTAGRNILNSALSKAV